MTDQLKQIQCDCLIYGGTEAGIFTAVRTARSGMRTIFISETTYLFGFFPSLGAWETHYPGCRAPLSDEVKSKLINYYRFKYGENSQQFRDCVNLEDNNPMVTFEPQAAEAVLQNLIYSESKLRVLAPCHLESVNLSQGVIQSILCRTKNGAREISAPYFVDCSYTGDLGAMAGARFVIGRESRSDFHEPHAGRIFTRWRNGRFPKSSLDGQLNILPTWTTTKPIKGSSGEGDDNIQDYSYRICLSSEDHNRILPGRPDDYDPNQYLPLLLPPSRKSKLALPFHHRWLTQSIEELMANDHLFHGHKLPNNKRSWNSTNLTGAGKAYSDADQSERNRIEQRHINHALGLLYFLQNDEKVPKIIKSEARKWGLAKDEFSSHGNLPPAIYVRESRRFKGDYIYREQDCLKTKGLDRAPLHKDGIAFTEFALDSLPCTPERLRGSLPDGQFFEKDKTLPGSLPWRSLRPLGINNLLLPTNPSVTHCAWGTVRQTASLLHLAEVAAYAIVLCKSSKTSCTNLSPFLLQIYLVSKGTMTSFLNDLDLADPEPWKQAAVLFGSRGFFYDYNTRPNDLLKFKTAEVWTHCVKSILADNAISPEKVARAVKQSEASADNGSITKNELLQQLGIPANKGASKRKLTRKKGLEIIQNHILQLWKNGNILLLNE